MATNAATRAKTEAKKKAQTDIVPSDINEVLKQLATGDPKNLQGADPTLLAAVAKQLGFDLAVGDGAAEAAPKFSRTAQVQKWAEGETSLSEKEQETFLTLPEVIGTAKVADPANVTQEEIDGLVKEFVVLRDSEDPVKGRKANIREQAIAIAIARGGESLDLVSLQNGYKLAVTKKGGGPGEPQVAKLEEHLTPEQWEAITVEETTRVVDPTKLALALADPKVAEAVKAVTPDVPVTYALTPRPLKKGDTI